jgi:hypothetical protein
MAAYLTFSIGSDSRCDITLERASVAGRHAELVIAKNGKIHLTDRDTGAGTYRQNGEDWIAVQQAYVTAGEPIRFGDYHTTVSVLLNIIAPNGIGPLFSGSGQGQGGNAFDPRSSLPTGRVRRSIETGEIIAVKDDE